MAQARVAVGAVLTTVTDTANAVSGVVNTISGSLDMLNAFVRHQQTKQRFDQKADLKTYKVRRIEELSQEAATRKKAIADLLQDPVTASYYNESYAELQSLLED